MKPRMKGCCDCGGCSLQCRSKTGFATLCGFDEFTAPSDPPRKYRRKSITGTITQCDHPSASCAPTPCGTSNPSEYRISGTGGFDGVHNPKPYVWSAVVVLDHYDPATNNWFYKVESVDVSDPTDGDHSLMGGVVTIGGYSGLTVGNYAQATPCLVIGASIQIYDNGWATLLDSMVSLTVPPADDSLGGIGDDWNVVSEYTPGLPAACVAATDDTASQRVTYGPGNCGFGGTPDAGGPFASAPDVAYGSNVALASETKTERDYEGVGCVASGDHYTNTAGTLVEALGNEDTPADAIARASVALEWGGDANCSFNTAYITGWTSPGFTFGFRNVEVRALCGSIEKPLLVGHTYRATISIVRRELGSSGPFLAYGVVEVTFTATATIDTTDYVAVPNDEGWESKAYGCALEKLD